MTGEAPHETGLRLCVVCPFTLLGTHPVAEHVRGVAAALARRGHLVTVLAPSSSSHALRAGRRRLRALAGGDLEALTALPGEPLVVAVGPAVPLRQRGRRRGAGLPVAVRANVALAVQEGAFDIVHAHEPLLPGLSAAALKHSRGLTVATFHSRTERALPFPVRSATRERYASRIDALLATSEEAAELASQVYQGDYTIVPSGVADVFQADGAAHSGVVVEWTPDGRSIARALVKLAAERPDAELTLMWERRGRRPLRPHVPPAARGRVHTVRPADDAARAAVLQAAAVFVAAPDGDPNLAWEARACGCAVAGPGRPDEPALRYGADQPALAAAAAARLLDDPVLREQMAAEGAEAVRPLRFEVIANTLEEEYSRLRRRLRVARRPVQSRPEILADLHMHTSHSHDCTTPVEALVDHCVERGLGAIAITDHNEVAGGLEAQELGRPITIIVGEEVKTSQGEVIGLFLKERIEPRMSMADTIAAIQDQGGLVYMPHPFDRMHTIPSPATLLRCLDQVDVFEVYNSRLLFDSFNADALRFATKYNLLQAAGSDAHVLPGIGTALNRMPAFDGPEEFLLSLRHNQIERRPKSLLYLQGLKWVHQVSR
ncbi:MAG: glycosyltransferase [Gaiellales bacterium]